MDLGDITSLVRKRYNDFQVPPALYLSTYQPVCFKYTALQTTVARWEGQMNPNSSSSPTSPRLPETDSCGLPRIGGDRLPG